MIAIAILIPLAFVAAICVIHFVTEFCIDADRWWSFPLYAFTFVFAIAGVFAVVVFVVASLK